MNEMIKVDFESLSLASTPDMDLHLEWEPVRTACAGSARLNAIIDDAVAHGRHTFEYTRADLGLWARELFKKIGPGCWHSQAQNAFSLVIGQPGLKNLFPRFRHDSEQLAKADECGYLTPELERDLHRFRALRGREAIYSRVEFNLDTERDRIQHVYWLCQYAVEQLNIWPLVLLDQVFTEPVISSWIEWLHDKKEYKRSSLKKVLSSIHNMLIKHPDYWKQDLRYFRKLARKYEKEVESAKAIRKEARMVDYKELLTVIGRMRQERLAAMKSRSRKRVAWLVHDQLLCMFMVLALWPAQCIRKCRIRGDSPNLFKGLLLPEDMPADLQPWASKLLSGNSAVQLWQYRFSSKEVLRNGAIHGVVHNFLIRLLEKYLRRYRAQLLKGKPDPGTLFFSRYGNPLNENALIEHFGNLTFKYGYSEKRVLPRNVPRIFGNYWERNHPGRYEELASIVGMRIPTVRGWFEDEPTARGRAISSNRR